MALFTNNKSLINGLVLVSICTVSATVIAQQQPSYQLLGGVIVDKEVSNIYAINANGGLDSISLQTGLVNWHSDKAALPIMIGEGFLLAQESSNEAGKLSLKALNTGNGEETQSKQLTMPNNILVPIADGIEHKFTLTANFDNNQNGDLLWSSYYQAAQGMVSIDTPKPVKSYGTISLDNSRSLNSVNVQVLQQAHQNTNQSVVGQFINNPQIDSSARQFKSVNSEHILVSQLKTNPSQWDKYTWDVYDINGQQIGSLNHSNSYSPFVVSGKTIVFINQPNIKVKNNDLVETPLTMQAVSLVSGNVVWDKEVKDLRFSGSYPH